MSSDSNTNEQPKTEAQPEKLSGYELVADMMRRQDDVILELDSLNARIESAIKQITDERKAEEEQLLADQNTELEEVKTLSIEAQHAKAPPARKAA